MSKYASCLTAAAMLGLTLPMGCSPLDWPAAPLYDEPTNDPGWVPPSTVQQAMAAIKGHYAHYDVVAYEGKIQTGTMRTFVVSYGFTDFAKVGNKLIEYDRFCHAEHKINQEGVTTSFNDAATQAIRPRMALVNVYQEDGSWKIWRPATPTLIGIDGNPDLPLSMDPNDPNINDADRDGHPGVTVDMKLGGAVKAQIYIARREVFQSDLTLYSDGTLFGHVVDDSEQLVVGATMAILAQPNNPEQYSDLSLSPIMLIPIPRELDTCEELMANRDALFPPAPEFQ